MSKLPPLEILRCPRCAGPLAAPAQCRTCGEFATVRGQPVLIDFSRSIFTRDGVLSAEGASPVARSAWRRSVKQWLFGRNRAAERAAADLAHRLPPSARVLVIGGGEVGSGAERLHESFAVVGTDIYASPHTALLADAHNLPFTDGAFDAVWIQAVLEHVLEPAQVVAEIHRVLRPEGLVFADTPFLQHVHEGAYDFTRFTLSGHRWLFRRFDLIDAGVTGGAGTALLWAVRGFVTAVTGRRVLGRAAGLAFCWLPWFDGRTRGHEDVAAGTYFYGRRSEALVSPHAMAPFYEARR
ncbi:methyltransferase domain-containing protein [Phenylobacterium sp.]|uniref:methyltransferase domain-containing protein n=1 Tax=Phenylobacterium sp. TaxID=1871053 RepID=UPI0035AFCE22